MTRMTNTDIVIAILIVVLIAAIVLVSHYAPLIYTWRPR